MKDKIALIGSGHFALQMARELCDLGHKDVALINPENVGDLSPQVAQEYILENHRMPELLQRFQEKRFVCKGRHEYREVRTGETGLVKVDWVCQCGRKL